MEITVLVGKRYRFCEILVVNRCKATQSSAQKSRHSTSASSSIFKRYMESCFGMVLDCDRSLKKVKDHGED